MNISNQPIVPYVIPLLTGNYRIQEDNIEF